jgi:hypothetical protein
MPRIVHAAPLITCLAACVGSGPDYPAVAHFEATTSGDARSTTTVRACIPTILRLVEFIDVSNYTVDVVADIQGPPQAWMALSVESDNLVSLDGEPGSLANLDTVKTGSDGLASLRTSTLHDGSTWTDRDGRACTNDVPLVVESLVLPGEITVTWNIAFSASVAADAGMVVELVN